MPPVTIAWICLQEMRLAALLAKAQSNKAEELPAYQALQMATLNSAKALGMGRSYRVIGKR